MAVARVEIVRGRQRSVLADLLAGSVARELALVLGAACFVGAMAQISIPLGFTPVPITGQTLGVAVAGAALGGKRAVAALSLYLVAGLAGLPWFAGHAHGYPGALFGYLLGFVAAAAVCGILAEHGADRRVVKALPAMLVGDAMIYLIGVPWLAVSLHVGLGRAIALGLTPYLAVDAVKIGIAAGLLPGAWRLAGVRTGR